MNGLVASGPAKGVLLQCVFQIPAWVLSNCTRGPNEVGFKRVSKVKNTFDEFVFFAFAVYQLTHRVGSDQKGQNCGFEFPPGCNRNMY